ncbi:hypothetical protein MJK71_23245 [Escherichia coli]|nr:hypothetical protein MJK71_23245 [Escherichia coli]
MAAGYNPQTQNPDDYCFYGECYRSGDGERDRVKALQIPVNAGSVDMLEPTGRGFRQGIGYGCALIRGFGHGHSQKTNTGGENSKHGIWYSDLARRTGRDTTSSSATGRHSHAHWFWR